MNPTFEIPQGRTAEIIDARERIITDFHEKWTSVNPERRIYNAHLGEFIYTDNFPVRDLARKAARSYQSTLTFIYLTEILECADEKCISVAYHLTGVERCNANGNKKQSKFI